MTTHRDRILDQFTRQALSLGHSIGIVHDGEREVATLDEPVLPEKRRGARVHPRPHRIPEAHEDADTFRAAGIRGERAPARSERA